MYDRTPPKIQAIAELTADMVETLSEHFKTYQADGVVMIEVTSRGLWLQHPATGTRQFLGLARLPNKLRH
ncbi:MULTISPECIES: hypothetical protein [unclassified Paracoccus (in: a-proteobacteria)]|uniref:hypothetical protein n=1 Tax=unclassified Paracoccus (in: a-proteobacteria) TaxID=2688777 RepID=UPI0015FED043|nr:MULTISPECIES: hypothetical protein [unclassified Paracoccus (in: a-proteobacteria)]MBB1493115.1 hypothetical protein [Paracoccus sp. MC1854]MBB1499102.1 hypothetical protein [Paracoccus sp. MC1862]QQO46586.1 hypothetical protein JGR78_16885 [Paracoccus sp. MC1862]